MADFNDFFEKLKKGDVKIAVTGLGYVGMPLAVAFAEKFKVIGFDNNKSKIVTYKKGVDPTQEVGNDAIQKSTIEFTDNEEKLRDALFHIIAVPTPVNLDKTPDLTPVVGASRTVGRNLLPGSIVVYESTVYPGVTENICANTLEQASGLICGRDFKIAYSPERINPGDKKHRLKNIVKIVSGMDEQTRQIVDDVYSSIIEAGTYSVGNIKTAEAIKVVENSQRDINIAFMNELAMVFNRMGVDTNEVVNGMNTKWNALGFRPGLVGGHCIGVDPYYFIYQAERLGYHSQVILAGRKINDGMGEFVADAAIKEMILAGDKIKGARVAILGLTFKENCPDIRNSKVIDIIKRLREYGVVPLVTDSRASANEAKIMYSLDVVPMNEIKDVQCVIVAVAHDEYKNLTKAEIDKMFSDSDTTEEKVIIDVKSIYDKQIFNSERYRYWNL